MFQHTSYYWEANNVSKSYLGGAPFVALLDALVEVFAHVHEIGVAGAFGTCSFKNEVLLIGLYLKIVAYDFF